MEKMCLCSYLMILLYFPMGIMNALEIFFLQFNNFIKIKGSGAYYDDIIEEIKEKRREKDEMLSL